MANALKEIEHAQRLCDRGDITIGEYFDFVKKWEDAEPIKHGRWIPVTNGRGGFECSVCTNYAPSYQDGVEWHSRFCPNCGAKMDKRREDG